MRIHIQNHAEPTGVDITEAEWHDAVRRAGAAGHDVTFGRGAAAFARALADAELLITIAGPLAELLPLPLNRLRTIFLFNAGVDRLAPFDWLPPGCALWNNSGAHAEKGGEYGIMAILMIAAAIPAFVADQRAERWAPVLTPSLRGRRLLVVGAGTLGAATARRARQFGMRATGLRRTGAPHPDFDTVGGIDRLDVELPRADFLVLACPLTPATRNLMTRARLERLPAGAGVVNIGRGALLDQEALCDLLDSGHLGGAVLDVTAPEPPPPGDRIWHAPRLILTPHVSVDDPNTYNALSLDICLANLRAEAEGRPAPNRVDLEHGY